MTIFGKDGAPPADITELPAKLQYLAYGHEVCPDTNRPHMQAWAYATTPQRLSGWKKMFPGAHIEAMRGNFAENDAYCSKAGTLVELGDRPMESGKKRTLHDLIQEVTTGAREAKPLDLIVDDTEHKDTFVQYHNGIKTLYTMTVTAKMRRIDKNVAPEVIYIYGPPGCGKSRYVHEQEDYKVYDVSSEDKFKWKCGYAGEEAVAFQNVAPDDILPTRFLKDIDRYFITVPTKGSSVGWRPLRVYITSVYPMETFAELAKFSLPAEFTRRVTKVINLGPVTFVP